MRAGVVHAGAWSDDEPSEWMVVSGEHPCVGDVSVGITRRERIDDSIVLRNVRCHNGGRQSIHQIIVTGIAAGHLNKGPFGRQDMRECERASHMNWY